MATTCWRPAGAAARGSSALKNWRYHVQNELKAAVSSRPVGSMSK
jgi:hypothetical protein